MKAMIGLALLLLAVPVSAGPPALPVCDSSAGFAGGVISDAFAPGTVKLDWTVYEDASIRGYRLMRSPASAGAPHSSGSIDSIARVSASTPDGFKARTFIDTAPPGDWTYRLEIDRRRGPSCALETMVTVPSPPPCDLAALCSQVGANFLGDVIASSLLPSVRLQWTANAETAAVNGYRLSRFNCANPRDCSTEIATISPTGTCGQVQLHSLTDTLPAGAWTYRLEVLDSRGRTSCTFDHAFPAQPQ